MVIIPVIGATTLFLYYKSVEKFKKSKKTKNLNVSKSKYYYGGYRKTF